MRTAPDARGCGRRTAGALAHTGAVLTHYRTGVIGPGRTSWCPGCALPTPPGAAKLRRTRHAAAHLRDNLPAFEAGALATRLHAHGRDERLASVAGCTRRCRGGGQWDCSDRSSVRSPTTQALQDILHGCDALPIGAFVSQLTGLPRGRLRIHVHA